MAFLGSFFRAALSGGDSGSSVDEPTGAAAAKPVKRPPRGKAKTAGRGGRKAKEAEEPMIVTKPSAALHRMLRGFPFADAEILVGKDAVRFPVHSAILSIASPVLEKEFYNGGADLRKKTVALPDADPDAFLPVLQFAYTDDWGGNATLVLKMRRIAKALEMQTLTKQLSKAVQEDLSAADAVGVMQAAAEEHDASLVASALEAALADPPAAIASKSIKFLTAETLGSLVARSDFAAPELEIIEACFRWAARRIGAEATADEVCIAPVTTGTTRGKADDKPATADSDGTDATTATTPASSSAAAAAASGAGGASGEAAGSVLTGDHPAPLVRVPAGVVVGKGKELRAALEPEILPHLRFPQVSARELATNIKPWGVLTAAEIVQLMAFQFKERDAQKRTARVAGFLAGKREGLTTSLLIHCWGGGGASGQDSSCAGGGAGGYICVRYEAEPGEEELEVYVGAGGYADASGGTSSLSTKAWPNGGCGGYSWCSGGGGASSHVKSKIHGGEVIVGAGGGGGGTAPRSWACGGGGGGGTKDGKVGEGGQGGNQPTPSGVEGKDGGGRGGRGESSGSGTNGKHANGAGGGSGSSTKADGGDGGDASFKHAELVNRIDAKTSDSIEVAVGGRPRQAGKGGSPGKPKERGKNGMVIIENEDTGSVNVFTYRSKPGKGSSPGVVHKYRVE